MLSGPTPLLSSRVHTCVATTHLFRVDSQPSESGQLVEQLRSFWELESLGIHEEERTLYDDFSDMVTFQEGRYKVSLPWKELHKPLTDNYQLCVRRLNGLLKRLRNEPEILKQYDSTIREQLEKGIIEPVQSDEETTNIVHYLPHHGVVRADKATTKLRIVYDASAKTSGPSLNECLYKGPKFHQLVFDILLRFRAYRCALVADVEKAFLMIAMDEKDRDALRFVWVDDVTKEKPELRTFRFTRVVFGISSSPFLLNATVRYHLERFLDTNENVVQRLLQSTYVDDIISGAESEEETFELYAQAKEIFRQGGFNLRKFLSSSQTVQSKIDAAEGTLDSGLPASEVKVLGVIWNPSSDSLVFDLSDLSAVADNLQPTKRNLVSLIGRFYDPLGYLAPGIIKYKIFFQRLCQSKLDWDADLPDELQDCWRVLLADLREASLISIPRCYYYQVEGTPLSYTLCGFCDASQLTYAAVIYLVIESASDTEVKFLTSKTRVAPIQPLTIPRLELLSAFLLSKLTSAVTDCLSTTLPKLAVRCYTDSQVALYWIRGTSKEWKPFVNNRVKDIRKRVSPSQWSHCPGSSNPADLPSRGVTFLELSVNLLWRRGPEWLQSGFEPNSPTSQDQNMPEDCLIELKPSQPLCLVTTTESKALDSIIDLTRFNSLQKLLRMTAMVLRAVKRFKRATEQEDSLRELQDAELLWIKSAQLTLTCNSVDYSLSLVILIII